MEAYKTLYNPFEEEEKREHFTEPYMHKNSTSDMFLEKVEQDVPLQDLKTVIRSCYFDENLLFCAILVQIHD